VTSLEQLTLGMTPLKLKLKLKLISDITGTANAGDDTNEIEDNLPTVYLQNLPLGTTIM
jgi:hypothetical protein